MRDRVLGGSLLPTAISHPPAVVPNWRLLRSNEARRKLSQFGGGVETSKLLFCCGRGERK